MFITRHAEGEEAGDEALSRTLFYPGDAVGSGSVVSTAVVGQGLRRGEVKVAGATQLTSKRKPQQPGDEKARHPHDGCQDGPGFESIRHRGPR